MRTSKRIVLVSTPLAAVVALAGCGGGPSVQAGSGPASLSVVVNVGAPLTGAAVSVVAINDSTGLANQAYGQAGVIGVGGPTDAKGVATVNLSPYSGPIQIVVSGAGASYLDPALPVAPGSVPTASPWPVDALLTSYLSTSPPGATGPIPVTMLTTLADHEALAIARGLHPGHPRATTIRDALGQRDPLLASHIAPSTVWSAAAFRTVEPSSLSTASRSLDSAALAAIFDVALHQLARDLSAQAGFSPGAPGQTAGSLLKLFGADLDADAILDGRGAGGVQLIVEGSQPVPLDAQSLRLPLAKALDSWIRGSRNLSGITETDLLAAKVYASMVQDGSDLFAEPPSGDLSSVVDHTPPLVAWVTLPPEAVARSSVRLIVAATDGQSGVGRVLATVGSGLPVQASQQVDGTWSLDLPLAPGPNIITAWSEDQTRAVPNSGRYAGAPYELTAVVISDVVGPAIGYAADGSGYWDERGMTVAKDPSGLAVTPARYRLAGSGPTRIPAAGGAVYKTAARLGWTAPPTPAELEDLGGGNVGNIPVLQFWNAYVEGVDAPVAQATYSIAFDCPTCSGAPASGSLWASPRIDLGRQYWDLPLSAALVPGLAALAGPAKVSVTVTISDVAGNSTSSVLVTFDFHLIGDPVAAVEDGSYQFKNDPKSTYPYTIASGLYANLFNVSLVTFLPEERVRLVRFLVSNPAPVPVALTLPTVPDGWTARETWVGTAGASLGTRSYTPSRTVCTNAPTCAGATPVLFLGGSAGAGCGTSPPHAQTPGTDVPIVGQGGLTSFAYNQAQGWDSSPAQQVGPTQVVVPPASAGAPGLVALYFGRPASLPARIYLLPWNGSSFEYLVEDAWTKTSEGASICCQYDAELRRCMQSDAPTTWAGTRFQRFLAAGDDVLTGTFQLTTQPLSGTTPIGEPNPVPGNLNLARTIHH